MTCADPGLQRLSRGAAYTAVRSQMAGAEALLVDCNSLVLQPYEPPARWSQALPLALSDDMRQIFDKMPLAQAQSFADMDRNQQNSFLPSLFFDSINAGSRLVLEDVIIIHRNTMSSTNTLHGSRLRDLTWRATHDRLSRISKHDWSYLLSM